jgi:hypothetical protein
MVVAVLLTAAPAMAADTGPTAPIHQFIDGFNKGDVAAAKAAHDPAGVTIVDEPAPHVWSGPKAFDTWLTDLTAGDKAAGREGGAVKLGKVIRTVSDGKTAYVLVAAVYTFNEKGVAMVEPATMTYALKKIGKDWKIAAWTWSGPDPKPAKK